MLDLLRGEPLTTGELAERFPEVSRFAVMQHLRVLEEASLVLGRRRGRRHYHYLNAVPLREVYERWVDRFAGDASRKALALKRYAESKEEDMAEAKVRTVRISNEMKVKAPLERVWAAATTEQGRWYPHTYGGERVKAVVFEEKVGGMVYEDWGDDMGVMYGNITYFDPPRTYATRGGLSGGIMLEQWMSLEEDGEFTIVKGTTTCLGEISDEMEEQIRMHGSLKNYEEAFRAYVEAA